LYSTLSLPYVIRSIVRDHRTCTGSAFSCRTVLFCKRIKSACLSAVHPITVRIVRTTSVVIVTHEPWGGWPVIVYTGAYCGDNSYYRFRRRHRRRPVITFQTFASSAYSRSFKPNPNSPQSRTRPFRFPDADFRPRVRTAIDERGRS